MASFIHSWWKAFVNFFFPRFCPACSCEMLSYENPCCLDCQTHLPHTYFETIHNNPVFEKVSPLIHVTEACSLFYFEKNSSFEALIYALKFAHQEHLGHWLGILSAQKLLDTPYKNCTGIVPLPLHPNRQRERGYNQVALFGKILSENVGIPYRPDIVRRVKNTRQLSRNATQDRFGEMEKAFVLTANRALKNPHWLLVDDIITTGATLQSCGKCLLEYPESKLSILTLGYRM